MTVDLPAGHPPLLVKAADAARMLCIGKRKLWELTNCGDVPCVRLGRAIRYRPCDLEAWIAAHLSHGREGGSH